ncbi:MAG TPA: glycoside hydrolase domain-containing protein, partial [Candidatus Sulfotelmatobacter sp.]|nr:glycoside hydrolase domain-containing protein [Candidatus Sulfotelmatobacter sp.]
GQMSAWYLFTAMGFYPVCPASDYYVIGSPAVKKAVMHLSNGKKFTMLAEVRICPRRTFMSNRCGSTASTGTSRSCLIAN